MLTYKLSVMKASASKTKRYTLKYLTNRKTLHVGHFDDLKIERPGYRVWLSRCTIADGMPYNNQVVIEELINGEWRTTAEYQAR